MTESASWDTARAAQDAAIDSDVLASAALACRDAERIRFGYVAANGERTERHVEPHRLVVARPALVPGRLRPDPERLAQLPARPARRGAAADRAPGSARGRCPPPTPPISSAGTSPPPPPAELASRGRVEAPAAAVRERIGRWATVTEAGPNRCRVTMNPEKRLAGDRARGDGRGLPGAVPAGTGRAGRGLGCPLQPGDPAAAGTNAEVKQSREA